MKMQIIGTNAKKTFKFKPVQGRIEEEYLEQKMLLTKLIEVRVRYLGGGE